MARWRCVGEYEGKEKDDDKEKKKEGLMFSREMEGGKTGYKTYTAER